MKKTLELKTAIIIFILMTSSIVSILGSVKLFDKISYDKQADFWFDVSLSFITALFSAGIAYIVASIQIRATKKIEEGEREIQNSKDINLILIEMKDNIDVMNILIESLKESPDESITENQFSVGMWERLINKIEIPNNVMADLLRVIKKKELVFYDEKIDIQEMIDFEEEYRDVYFKLNEYLKKHDEN